MIGLPVRRDAQSQAGTALMMMMAQASNRSSMVGSAGAQKFRKTKPRQIARTRKRLPLIFERSLCSRDTSPALNQLMPVSYELLTAALDASGMLMKNESISFALAVL